MLTRACVLSLFLIGPTAVLSAQPTTQPAQPFSDSADLSTPISSDINAPTAAPRAQNNGSAPQLPMKLSRFTSNVDLTVGFMYLQNDINSTAGGRPGYLLGWYAVPQYDFTKHFSAIADFTNFYNWHAHTGENVHGFAGGIVYRYALPRLRLTPFTFAEAGGGRDSYQRTVSWSPQLIGGVGANFQLTKRLSLQLIPALFVNTQLGNGNWQTSYAPKVGFTFDLGSLRRKH